MAENPGETREGVRWKVLTRIDPPRPMVRHKTGEPSGFLHHVELKGPQELPSELVPASLLTDLAEQLETRAKDARGTYDATLEGIDLGRADAYEAAAQLLRSLTEGDT